ncbi:MAG: ATP-binding protein [Ktedonobacteraceae bacterium]|nr:ATP-binding protein [Ktedonobacteraceae bacterium]
MTQSHIQTWNTVVTPHADILADQLRIDTYAVNLGQVVQNDTQMPLIYRDPHMFFEATYLTTALDSVLKEVFRVLCGGTGDRVFLLRTPFGGGKTHTLLALYHLANARAQLNDIPELSNIPSPGPVRTAIFSGLATGSIDQQRAKTLWGDLAWQIGKAEGYNLVAEQDRALVAPGASLIMQLIGNKPTLFLLDEILNYVENAMAVGVGESNLGRQTILFLQRLTEAVAASPNAAMVYSLQASDREASGNLELLDTLSRIGQRLNAIREPVTGDEVLSVVQRRLFARPTLEKQLLEDQQRRLVANAYAASYKSFLLGTFSNQEAEQKAEQLRERIRRSYPFHPALLDLMSERWNSIPGYQRTRGALQFLATVIHALWKRQGVTMHNQPLIGPGDIPLENSQVRTNFLAQVGEQTQSQYDAVIRADLLGEQAGARIVDALLIRENPNLQLCEPGTRLATAAMLYSFDGRSAQYRGVTESDLLRVCLIPHDLERNVLQRALYDLNERLLYLHRRAGVYLFETQANLNKMIMDENQRRTGEEVEERMLIEFNKMLNPESKGMKSKRESIGLKSVTWPQDTDDVDDRIPEFQVVYLAPEWLDAHPDPLAQERDMRRFVEQHGNRPRDYHNGLALAVPNRHTAETAKNAVRSLMTLEILQNRRYAIELAPHQMAELSERKQSVEKEMKSALLLLYEHVYTPISNNKPDPIFVFQKVTVLDHSQAPELPTRMREALNNRAVYESVNPNKIVDLTRLNESTSVEKQFYRVSDIITGFFSYYKWTHIWNEQVVRNAVVQGVKNRTFAYVANARKDQDGNLILGSQSTNSIQFGNEIVAAELDMGEGAFLLSGSYAEQLQASFVAKVAPVVESVSTPVNGISSVGVPPVQGGFTYQPSVGTGSTIREPGGYTAPPLFGDPMPPPARPAAPGQGGKRYRLRVQVNMDQFYDAIKALQALSEENTDTMDILVIATAKPGQAYNRNKLYNRVVEPMVEGSNVDVIEEQVEE